ncbi:MAG: GntR family transcriptional regulator [Reyranella sp.]|jgi:DNA-binding GntR family transcriptional regulator|uniref:GntR family transcriptional regulator n=1 Tax=Reyranella sp. TaxID=1929291 RepID=UPI001AC218A7|nr:GntR family transcriptional regulator [Reyranella sp.]MBN9536675.1 GntR family transcriptional regulator [Alphaproteobacteria bacterium]MBR2815209.1 GntR family transcriptional regulator [Reyranella sp.]
MKLRRATLSDDAYGAVRTMLLDPTRFAPGSKISVEEMARELGVSRSPVWSAISRLEAEGLVRVEPRRGVFRIGFDPDKLRTLFETREALESFAARLAAERMTEQEFDETAQHLAAQRAALKKKNVDDYSTATIAFHEAITASARNPMIARLLSSIYDQVHAICGGRSAAIGWPGRAANIEDHANLLDRLRRRDADGAEKITRQHAQRLAAGVFETMGAEASV